MAAEAAQLLCKEDAKSEEAELGCMPPSLQLDPLLDGGYTEKEYEMMERDRGKYLLYMVALQKAVEDMLTDDEQPVRVAVVGCGRGRLIEMALDASPRVNVWAVDCNSLAVEACKERFRDNPRVVIKGPAKVSPRGDNASIFGPDVASQCDIMVSELLGSFACNEFAPEIAVPAAKAILKPGRSITIPTRWTAYAVPVCCPAAHRICGGKSGFYMFSLVGDAYLFGEPRAMWSSGGGSDDVVYLSISGVGSTKLSKAEAWSIEAEQPPAEGGSRKRRHEETRDDSSCVIHGLAGYFTADLYGGVVIDTRLNAGQRNCMHWESMFFPLPEPIRLPDGSEVSYRVRRCTALWGTELWYEWSVVKGDQKALDRKSVAIHNEGGEAHKVRL